MFPQKMNERSSTYFSCLINDDLSDHDLFLQGDKLFHTFIMLLKIFCLY